MIEYFYSAHSAFAYIGSRRFQEIADRAGRRIQHRPIDLRKVVERAASVSFAERSAAHRAYYFGREIERWAEFRGMDILDDVPSTHHHDITLVNCFLIAGDRRGENIDRLADALLTAHWCEDADLANPDVIGEIASANGYDPAPLLDGARSEAIQSLYRVYTQEAIERSVFGSPTYFLDGDMFYGQDRLEMLERALETPFAGTWPKPAA